jgi:hypothetical protein
MDEGTGPDGSAGRCGDTFSHNVGRELGHAPLCDEVEAHAVGRHADLGARIEH